MSFQNNLGQTTTMSNQIDFGTDTLIDKMFTCQKCLRNFNTKNQLDSHQWTHTDGTCKKFSNYFKSKREKDSHQCTKNDKQTNNTNDVNDYINTIRNGVIKNKIDGTITDMMYECYVCTVKNFVGSYRHICR